MNTSQGVFGARFRAERRQKKLSQSKAAQQLGVSRSTVIRIESGEGEMPSAVFVMKAADLFECSAQYLMGTRNLRPKPVWLRDDQTELVALYEALDDAGRAAAKEILKECGETMSRQKANCGR